MYHGGSSTHPLITIELPEMHDFDTTATLQRKGKREKGKIMTLGTAPSTEH